MKKIQRHLNKMINLPGVVYRNKQQYQRSINFKRNLACMYIGVSKEEVPEYMQDEKTLDLIDYYTLEVIKSMNMMNYNTFISSGADYGNKGFFHLVDQLKRIRRSYINNIIFFRNENELMNHPDHIKIIEDADLIFFSDNFGIPIDEAPENHNELLMIQVSSLVLSVYSPKIESKSTAILRSASQYELDSINIKAETGEIQT